MSVSCGVVATHEHHMISGQLLRFSLLISGVVFSLGWSGCARAVESIQKSPNGQHVVTAPMDGRYQLVVVPGHPGNPFLIDTHTGCIWHYGQNEKNKRATFIESDVENLHWGWGSGAQQILAAQIDTLTSSEEQKKVLRQNLQKTECGQFNVTLSPDHSRKPESPESKTPNLEK